MATENAASSKPLAGKTPVTAGKIPDSQETPHCLLWTLEAPSLKTRCNRAKVGRRLV